MTHTYPLGVARAVAVRTLTELGTQRPGWRPNPDYWMELLAEALRQMVDATAPDRVIDVAPLPEAAAEVLEVNERGWPTGNTLPAPAGHLAQHTGGQPGCTYPDCRIHQPAPTREVSAVVLAAHPLDGAR